ncbi:hypothetical protein [Nocardia abscessus]|uniref:hypothetical protein n=1 Tax=Nocardia abscessus TaxID=120957 RepID=UPI002455C7A7|nr:hypothetical protein [Nocardia abscessus]
MSINPFSLFGLVAALDSRNIWRSRGGETIRAIAPAATLGFTTVHQSVSAGAQWSGVAMNKVR